MSQAKQGDKVKIHYTGRLGDGTVFDSSIIADPLEFTIGEREVIVGLEEAVLGMSPGESKTVTIPAEKAYGQRSDDHIVVVERSKFPPDIQPAVGKELELRRREDGQTFPVKVVEVSDTEVKLDGNHYLAGQDLTFDIQVLDVIPASQ